MRKLLLLFVLLLPFTLAAQNEALNDKYGFRDATFETPLSSFKGMKLVKSEGHVKTYTRSTDKLTIGEYPVAIQYVFLDGQLSQVVITTKGVKNVTGIGLAMIEAYGVPKREGLNNTWVSTRVILTEKVAPDATSAVFRMASVPLVYRMTEIEKSDANKEYKQTVKGAKKAASDL